MQWKVYFIWQPTSPVAGLRWPAQWLDWEEAPKHFPKPNLHQKKIMVTVWWSADHLTCDSFWISVKLLHLRSMLSKSVWCTLNWNACSQRWSTERAQFFSMTTPSPTSHNQCFKSWMNWATKFCLIRHIHLISHQLAATSSSISTTFCRQNASTESRKYFPRVRQIPKHGFLHCRNKQTYFLFAKMCRLSWFLFWLLKMFEPSYNDLKFMIQTFNYFCNNLNSK